MITIVLKNIPISLSWLHEQEYQNLAYRITKWKRRAYTDHHILEKKKIRQTPIFK